MPAPALPYWRLSSFYFWYYAALGGFTPYFAQWLHDLGYDGVAIGMIMALWYAARVFAPTTWSALADRSPRPIAWLRGGAVLATIGFAGFLWARGFVAIAATMLVFSTFCNAIMPQFEALTLDTLGARRADYGRLRVWGSVGFIVITLAFGWVLERDGSGALPLLMLPLFAAIAISAFANRMPAHAAHHAAVRAESSWKALRRPGVATFLTVAMLMQISFGPYYVFFTLFLGEHGHRTDTIGALWSLGVLAEIGLFLIVPALLRRYGPVALLLVCLATATVRWLATALVPGSLAIMIALQVLHAFTFGMFHASCMQLIGAYFPGRRLAQGQALLYAVGSGVGGVIGAALAGLAWKFGGGLACFVLGAVAAAIGYVVAMRLRVPDSDEDAFGAAAVTADA